MQKRDGRSRHETTVPNRVCEKSFTLPRCSPIMAAFVGRICGSGLLSPKGGATLQKVGKYVTSFTGQVHPGGVSECVRACVCASGRVLRIAHTNVLTLVPPYEREVPIRHTKKRGDRVSNRTRAKRHHPHLHLPGHCLVDLCQVVAGGG